MRLIGKLQRKDLPENDFSLLIFAKKIPFRKLSERVLYFIKQLLLPGNRAERLFFSAERRMSRRKSRNRNPIRRAGNV